MNECGMNEDVNLDMSLENRAFGRIHLYSTP
jgi:hypothetical protein